MLMNPLRFSVASTPRHAHQLRRLSSAASALPEYIDLGEAEAKLKHTPFGETGMGHYSDATKGCFDVMRRLAKSVAPQLNAVLDRRDETGVASVTPFRLLDLGTADAGTSLALVRNIVEKVREREGADVPFEVVYEDQPGNDWVSVFRRTQGAIATEGMEEHPHPFVGLGAPVYVLASGQSFYDTCVSPGSVDLALCATAMHWLRKQPVNIPDALHSACTANSHAAGAYAAQAALDWLKILQCRRDELKVGGAIVIANFAVDERGQFLTY